MPQPPQALPALSCVLRALPEDGTVAFGELAARLGSRAHGLALLLLSLPDAVPLPIPSLSAVLGLPMTAISLHLTLFGEGSGIPRWLARRPVPGMVIRLLRVRLAGLLAWAERRSQPRWRALAGRERLVGAACLLMSLLLLLPLPLFNMPPAICLSVLSWGLMRRDGAFVLVGLLAATGVMAVVAFAAAQSWQFVAAGLTW